MSEIEIFLNNVRGEWWSSERRVGKHTRKTNGEKYISPRIILSSEYNNLIGKRFKLYVAEGKVVEEWYSRTEERKGTMLILFFEDSEDDVNKDDFDDEF